jgi:hypothetical protein
MRRLVPVEPPSLSASNEAHLLKCTLRVVTELLPIWRRIGTEQLRDGYTMRGSVP